MRAPGVLRAAASGLIGLAAALAGATPAPEPEVLERLQVAPVWSGHPVGFAIDTAGERQYVAFYDAERRMTVAARALGSTEWSFKRLPSRLGWDSHGEVVLATDGAGLLHVAGNMHGDPLVYFRSREPYDLESLERAGMIGSRERKVTYPRFVRDAAGELLFHYRDGSSGNGVHIFNRWNAEAGRWSRHLDRPLFDGRGEMSAYMTGPLPGPDGRFHLVWVWRDTPSGATNHDLSYASSADLVRWETAAGEPLTLPITPAAKSAVVDPVAAGGGLAGIAFNIGWDGAGSPVLNYVKYDAAGSSQLYNARWEGSGWKIHRTSDWSWRWELDVTGSLPMSIVTDPVRLDDNGRLLQRFRHVEEGGGVWVLDPETLRPRQTLEPPGAMARLRRPESPASGMEVRELVFDRTGEYLLHWETLPHNRDRRRQGPPPPPAKLRVLRFSETAAAG